MGSGSNLQRVSKGQNQGVSRPDLYLEYLRENPFPCLFNLSAEFSLIWLYDLVAVSWEFPLSFRSYRHSLTLVILQMKISYSMSNSSCASCISFYYISLSSFSWEITAFKDFSVYIGLIKFNVHQLVTLITTEKSILPCNLTYLWIWH